MMARPFRPDHGLPKGPEHLWREMRRQSGDGFTLSTLYGAANGVAKRTIRGYLVAFEKAGAIRRVGQRPIPFGRAAIVWSLVENAPAKAPVIRRDDYAGSRGRVREQLWTAMRALPAFTVRELAFAATTEEHPVKPRTAERYVRELGRCGLLLALTPSAKGAPGRTGAHAARWRLKPSANTGPLPPKIIKGEVFDPNRNAVIRARKPGEAA